MKSDKPMNLPQSNIFEFKQLNAFLVRMTSKARRDYQSLKEFTENASHEIQTPLAVAKGKLELLQQSNNLDESQSELLDASQKALTKISRLGQALSLLAKIDNQEFTAQHTIDFSTIVAHTLGIFEEIAALKGVTLETKIQTDVRVKMDATLADILVTNLVKNAIQHNTENGWIRIHLDEHQFEVTNSGEELHFPPDQLFMRFKKSNQSKGSLGLGLAIVKKICDVSQVQVQYDYADRVHKITVAL
ncbi:MAG: HAMP domain-containing histidine kinase [Saprospiraceae bacterium]|nr:HAMP domain-containing histidine kinase [Saprospiraceae bacterium]